MNWKYKFGWAALIYAIGFAIILLVQRVAQAAWFPSSGSDVFPHAALFLVRAALYYVLARRARSSRLGTLLQVLLLIEAVDCTTVLLMGAPLSYLQSNWWFSALHAVAALVGLAFAWLSSNKSFKPKPLRGSA